MNAEQFKQALDQLVGEYAHLQHKAEIQQAHGQRVDPNILLRMSALYAWGKAHIHPNSFPGVVREVNSRVADLHFQRSSGEQQYKGEKGRSQLKNAVAGLTKGILGQPSLTPNQLRAIVQHQPLRARIPKQELTQAQRDEQMRISTRHIDRKGKGWGEKEFQRRMDELSDCKEDEFLRIVQKNGYDVAGSRQAVKMWKKTRLDIGLNERLRARREARGETDSNPVIREVRDSEHRKATLASAMITDAQYQHERGDSQFINEISESIPQRLLEEDSSRGAVARAFELVEQRGETY
jgi:hypothetical protein